MDRLPVEISSKILAKACFDDKATACSLNLTSKWISEVAETVRFEAVSLYGLPQIVGFAKMLEGLPPGHPKIKHLFISGIGLREAEKQRGQRQAKLRRLAVDYKLLPRAAEDDPPVGHRRGGYDVDSDYDLPQVWNDEFHTIFHRAASSVQTLFLTTMHHLRPATAIPCSLPNLIDFSITDSGYGISLPYELPQLRRLHTNSPGDRDTNAIKYRKNAPALEELRFSNLYHCDEFVDAIVAHAQCMEQGETELESAFPATMRRIILQQSAPPYGAWCGNAYMSHEWFSRRLHRAVMDVADSGGRGPLQLVLLKMPEVKLWLEGEINGLGYHFEDARKDWVDVISGSGNGCWGDTLLESNLCAGDELYF